MKHIATMALMLNLGVAGVYAQQRPVKMTFSGTAGASTINLQHSGTNNSEAETRSSNSVDKRAGAAALRRSLIG